MNSSHRHLTVIRACALVLTATAALAASATPASAYLLNKTSTCKPGQKWNTSTPVKVRILGDSVFDYLINRRPGTSTLVDLARLTADVKAVIDLYNSIPGSSMVLELDTGITGDSDGQWVDLTADLSAYAGQTVTIAFRYWTDVAFVADGYSLDEIAITGQPTDGAGSGSARPERVAAPHARAGWLPKPGQLHCPHRLAHPPEQAQPDPGRQQHAQPHARDLAVRHARQPAQGLDQRPPALGLGMHLDPPHRELVLEQAHGGGERHPPPSLS